MDGYHTWDSEEENNLQFSEPTDPWEGSFLPLTTHARIRMQQRRIDLEMIEQVIQFGREVCTRGAIVYALGRNEVARAAKEGHKLSHLEGIHVVTSHEDGAVLTVYRNRDLAGLKYSLGFGRQRPTGQKARKAA